MTDQQRTIPWCATAALGATLVLVSPVSVAAQIALESGGMLRAEFHALAQADWRDFSTPWRDAFLNAVVGRTLEVRGGRFKIPFSLDQLTGAAELDFAYR